MFLRTVGTRQHQNIVIVDILLLVGQFQEVLVHLVQLLLRQCHTQYLQTVLQRSTSASGCQYDGVVVNAHIVRVNDFVSLHVLQHTVLMDAR